MPFSEKKNPGRDKSFGVEGDNKFSWGS